MAKRMYALTFTERTPTPPERKDVNSYHILCGDMDDVINRLTDFYLNYGCLVSATIVEVHVD